MTGPSGPPPGRAARAYAILTWVYAAGFGGPAVPVSVYLWRRGSLPWLGDLFPMYAGPWSGRLRDGQFIALLLGYLALLPSWPGPPAGSGGARAAALWSAWCCCPVEAVFWVGFALPIPWFLGAARVALLAAAWPRLRGPRPTSPNSKEISHA